MKKTSIFFKILIETLEILLIILKLEGFFLLNTNIL